MPHEEEVRPEELGDYVPALFARSVEEAEEYRQVLEDHDIPAVVDEEYQPPKKPKAARGEGVAVLVPESFLEDARAFIAKLDELEALADEDDLDDEEEDELDDEDDQDEEDFDEEEEEEEEKEEEEEDEHR